jgi:hypothetical protein
MMAEKVGGYILWARVQCAMSSVLVDPVTKGRVNGGDGPKNVMMVV